MLARNLLTGVWALACVLLVAAAGLLLAHGRLQTDLLALLPATERSATAERAVAVMNNAAGSHAIFLIGHSDRLVAKQAARRFGATLAASRAFTRVQTEIPAPDPDALGLRPFRLGLLAEADRRALAGGGIDVGQRLLRRLNDPLLVGAGVGLAADPLGFYANYLASLPFRHLRLELDDGLLLARDQDSAADLVRALVSAELPGSAYDDRAQATVMTAVTAAEKDLQSFQNDVEVLRTGAVFYASAVRSAAEREVNLIGIGSTIGIVLMMLAVFRSLRPLLLGAMTVCVGLAAGVSATFFAYGELHLLTLVFGASLIGEAIDYSVQYFGAHAAAGENWEPLRGLAAVRPGLTLALATSAMGYGALLLMPFPAVKQIALFALAGLIAAFLSVILLLPALLRRPHGHDVSVLAVPAARLLEVWRQRIGRRAGTALALAIILASVPGWLRLQSDDDVRTLTHRPALLLQQEAKIRALTGLEFGNRFFVVEGSSAEDVLRKEERLTDRLSEIAARGDLGYFHALSTFVPSESRQTENRALLLRALPQGGDKLERVFRHAGLRQGIATQWRRAIDESEAAVLTPQAWLASPGSTPFRHLWLGETAGRFATIVVPFGASKRGSLEQAAAAEGVALVDKTAGVSRLFGEYRLGFGFGLVGAILVVLGVLSRRYGWSRGAAVLLPTLLGMAVALGIAGYAGIAVTLFTVMALMLVLGVGVNYAIFLVEGSDRGGITLVAVLLSAATTLLSFGLLAFSSTPALARFGSTLLFGITAAVLLAPLALTFGASRR